LLTIAEAVEGMEKAAAAGYHAATATG